MIDFINFISDKESFSQLGQDLLVLYLLGEKRDGYFVEFGATDGTSLSNTRLLEKNYGWSGILCEPSPFYIEILKNSDRTAIIDDRCVYSTSEELVEFIDTDARGLSTINKYSDIDGHADSRKMGNLSMVKTISLDDLLDFHNAPQVIDYMSIDTEGSEYDILSAFSFSRHINVITVEHNYNQNRDLIHSLLVSHGFVRIFEMMSMFDDWYIHEEVV